MKFADNTVKRSVYQQRVRGACLLIDDRHCCNVRMRLCFERRCQSTNNGGLIGEDT